jgi:phosphoglycolate phosphatase-like HAD superfamily hydrolase
VEVYGTSAEGLEVPGDTATAHIRRALASAGFDDTAIDAGLPRWCDEFSARYVELLSSADTSHWERAPHALEAVGGLERRALLTGNPAPVAHARMERLGLAGFFPEGHGAFGCERESRVELFALARDREDGWPAARTVAVGDTPLDVSTAHEVGCRSVAVTTGRFAHAELAHADAVIEDLSGLTDALAGFESA